MKTQSDLVRGWIAKAESDLMTAEFMARGPGPYDTACFHCQQVVERYLKAVLSHHSTPFPFVHDIRVLARLVVSVDARLDLTQSDVTDLTKYAVELRYDNDFWPSHSQVVRAVEVAHRVRAAVRAVLPSEVLT